MPEKEQEEKQEASEPNQELVDKIETLEKRLTDGQSWNTKIAQENAEMRGRIDQLSIQQTQPEAAKGSSLDFLDDDELAESLREDPAKAAELIKRSLGTMAGDISGVLESRDNVISQQLHRMQQEFQNGVGALNPVKLQNEDAIKEFSEGGTIPHFDEMPLDAQIAIIEMQPDDDSKPRRHNPPGSVGGGVASRTTPKEMSLADNPLMKGVWDAMGVGDDEESSNVITPTYGGNA